MKSGFALMKPLALLADEAKPPPNSCIANISSLAKRLHSFISRKAASFVTGDILMKPLALLADEAKPPPNSCIANISSLAKRLHSFISRKAASLQKGHPADVLFAWWSVLDSNQWPPRCEHGAPPTELTDHIEFSARFDWRTPWEQSSQGVWLNAPHCGPFLTPSAPAM